MEQIVLRCNHCPHEMTVDRFDPYTGCDYDAGYAYICPSCNGTMKSIRMAEPKPNCECDRVLQEIAFANK